MVASRETTDLTSRWQELGSAGPVRLEAIDVWMVELPFIQAVTTAAGRHQHRPLVLVRLMAASAGGPVEGWGECAALADSTYDREDVHGAFRTLEYTLLPELGTLAAVADRLPGPADLTGLRASAPESHMAFAALEMAVADIHLRAEGRSLADLLDVEDQKVELGAVVGIFPSEGELVEEVTSLVEQGYSRIKLKIGPGWDVSPLEAVRRVVARLEARSGSAAAPALRLQADANGSYSDTDKGALSELDRFDLLCLEQPLDPSDLAGHVRLAAYLRTPICLDESVRSHQDIARALEMGASSVVCLKPARLGGLAEALAVVERCRAGGIPLWMGGMFESGYARGVNTTLAALPGFSWPGDLSPAPSYLATDLVPAPELTRVAVTAPLTARPPAGPGMGEPPNLETVARLAVQHVRVALP